MGNTLLTIGQSLWNFILAEPVWFVVILISLWILPKMLFRTLHYWYAVRNKKNLVYMQVTLPRKDSKLDKEKETEKDFKEKIGVMEQFYRNIHEIRELNLANMIKSYIFNHDMVSFEYVLKDKELHFYVVTYKYFRTLVEKQITSYYPDADITYVDDYELGQKGQYLKGYYLHARRADHFPIRTYKTLENDPLNDITNVFSKLQDEDFASIQITLNSIGKGWQSDAEKQGEAMFKGQGGRGTGLWGKIPGLKLLGNLLNGAVLGAEKMDTNAPGADSGDSYVRMLQSREEIAKKIGEKALQVGFKVGVRVMAASKTKEHTDDILNNLVLAFNLFNEPEMNYFQNRRIIPIDSVSTPILTHGYKLRLHKHFNKESLMVPEELASMYHFPASKYNYSPTIKWLPYTVVAAPTNLPTDGILLGHNVFRGEKREVRMMKNDRTRHHYVIGKSGSGKSAFISFMARQDIANGDGVCVVDPHGDLIEDILHYVPKERAKDVIVFNPSDFERPMGLNILEANTPEEMDMASSQATAIFIKLFGDEIFGPRIQHYFRNACLTLMEDKDEGATLIDVPRMFTDDDFMRYKVSKIKNPVVKSFWVHEYAHTGDRERQEMIPYFSSKFGPFITNQIMRNTIGQTKSAFNFRDVMDNQKILLINLSKGKIGDLNTQLLGLVIVARIQMAAMSRADMPEEDRKDFFLYVDEFQNFATDSFCEILSEARKYRLALIMAHQYIGQLTVSKFGNSSTKIRDAVFGNAGTIMSFKVGAEDGEYLAKEYAPVLSEQDIIGMAKYKAYIKLNIDNTTSRPFSLHTIWDTSNKNAKIAEIIKQYSRMKYGRKKEFVDQEIAARIGIDLDAPPVEMGELGKAPGAKKQAPQGGGGGMLGMLQAAAGKQAPQKTEKPGAEPPKDAPPSEDKPTQ